MDELKALLQQEERWLRETERVVAEVRRLREEEMRRLRPAVVRRWALALVFALVSAAAAGASYAWSHGHMRPNSPRFAPVRNSLSWSNTES
jgi:hypothetical protein